MGRRLNIARIRFISTILPRMAIIMLCPNIGNRTWKIMAAMTAIITFVSGPARETRAISLSPSLRLKGSIGTGFAAPKITGEPDKIKISGSKILIIGSIWGFGLSVNLPASLAVGSPNRSATYPWAISCRIAEKTKMAIVVTANIISMFVLIVFF